MEKHKTIPILILWRLDRIGDGMRISLAESHAKGFNRWCAAHDTGRKDDGRIGASGPVAMADPEIEPAVIAPPEQPHRPWLVPGAGTL
ncbi:MAG: hypothetical protein WA417_03745 [Stellaceae bacterium]